MKPKKQIPSAVALYWDYQNVKPKKDDFDFVDAILSFAESLGQVVVTEAYADWRKESEQLTDCIYEIFTEINVPSYKEKRNRADKKLIKSCQTSVRNYPKITTVILISGDGGFTSLVKELKQQNKEVIVIPQHSTRTSLKLINAASKFYFIDEIKDKYLQYSRRAA